MVLTQAEQEGYSVFVVRKGNSQQSNEGESQDAGEGHGWGDGGVAVFPECQADLFALQLGEPVGRSGGMLNTSGGPTAGCEQSLPEFQRLDMLADARWSLSLGPVEPRSTICRPIFHHAPSRSILTSFPPPKASRRSIRSILTFRSRCYRPSGSTGASTPKRRNGRGRR